MPEPYPELEAKLRPLADPLPPPRPGDWLAEHDEPGQTFAEYLDARPVRKSDKLHTIYLCLVGDFSEAQRRILDLTQDYLALFFDCPVKVQRQIALASIPARARRTHPSWGDQQVLTGYLLHEVLEPERPADALAYLALTASDLWPGRGWNFVFGEANLRQAPASGPSTATAIRARTSPSACAGPWARRPTNWPRPDHAPLHRLPLPDERQQPPGGAGRQAAAPVPGLPAEAVLEPAGRAGAVLEEA